jgi:CHAT domain-containing protein/tetratricopeptide (TPR) repeat protein
VDFPHAPWDPAATSLEGAPATLLRVVRDIESEPREPVSTRYLSALALVRILTGRPEDAVLDLELAADTAGGDRARLLSDLSATRLEVARTDNFRLIAALSAAEEATRLAPALPEAKFNLALGLTHAGLTAQASDAWRSYLRLDSTSPWAAEASRHLTSARGAPSWATKREQLRTAALEGLPVESVVQAFPQQSRELAEEMLLEWVAMGEEHDHRGREILGGFARLAAAVALNGDRLLDLVARQLPPPAEVEPSLVRGLRGYVRGMELLGEGHVRPAEAAFLGSRTDLAVAGSPFAWLAWYRVAVCQYQLARYSEALAILRSLARTPELEDYPSLAGKVAWMTGLVEGVEGRPGASLEGYLAAARHFARVREDANAASVSMLLAEAYRYGLGDYRASWRHLLAALRSLPSIESPSRRANVVREAVDFLSDVGEVPLALLFHDVLLDTLGAEPNQLEVMFAELQRARLHAQAGDHVRATAALDRAERRVSIVPTAEIRDQVLGELWLARGKSLCTTDPASALPVLADALSLYGRTSHPQRGSQTRMARADCFERAGDPTAAAEDLHLAIDDFLDRRGLVPEGDLRISFLDSVGRAFERLEALELAAGRDAAALELIELSRARSLLDAIAPGGMRSAGATIRELVPRAAPPAAAIVELAFVDERLHAWVLRDGKAHHRDLHLSQPEARRLVGALDVELRAHSPAAGGALAELHRRVVTPLADLVSGATPLVFVPDGDLHRVPFAALWDAPRRRYLIEDHEIAVAPSATAVLLPGRRKSPSTAPRLLAVGDPELDRRLFPDLPRLPGAAREVKTVASFYSDATVLVGADATAKELTRLAPSHDVVHFAGHALVNTRTPSSSLLVLAPDSARVGAGSLVSIDSLRGQALDSVGMVVLSGCATGDAMISRSEGVMSMAQAFLARGVPYVLATISPVEDSAESDLMIEYHRRLASGTSPFRALRGAQLAALSHQPPRAWAPTQLVVGAGAMD